MYVVEVLVTNKEGIRDPEGETIQKYAVARISSLVKSTRAGKYFRLFVEANSPQEAESVARKVVEEARLYNPIVHEVTIRVSRDKGSCGN